MTSTETAEELRAAEQNPPPAEAEARAGAYAARRAEHWEAFAGNRGISRGLGRMYHRRLGTIYRFLVPEGKRVLELGCGEGNLLAALRPSRGVGVDFSGRMIAEARARHPELAFVESDVESVDLAGEEPFDVIILSDLLNELWDAQALFRRMRQWCHPRTRIILNTYSRLWQLPLAAARGLRLAKPALGQNWFTPPDVRNLLYLEGYETIRDWGEILWPVRTPLIETICNRILVKLWPLQHLALTQFLVARPLGLAGQASAPRVSVIVPARNEAGNIEAAVTRTPEMAGGTEIVFVEGGSSDETWERILAVRQAHPDRCIQAHRQAGRGKGDAVRLGFREATGDILMILDADLTVPPEDLPRFVEALLTGRGEFVNGVRLVYPMEKRAMRFWNLLGNKFFSVAFTRLLGQPVRDTLCGTKVLWREEYERIAAERSYFGDFDPFGDFDLLFGAARLNLRLVDLPVRYRERTYGDTNIQRWRHGVILLRMMLFAARRLTFV